MSGNWTVVRRMTILGAVLTLFFLVDGLVLLLTNGLGSDAGPVFPWLGGSFTKNRSSGAGLLIIGVIALLVMLVGWFAYGRRVRAAHRAEHAASPASGPPPTERSRSRSTPA
jgi:hypothetical protein